LQLNYLPDPLPFRFYRLLLFASLCWFEISCSSQKKVNPYAFSSTTDFYNAEKFEGTQKVRYRYLYAYNMKKVLYGNQCVHDVTRKFGFEYIPAFDSAEEKRNDLEIWAHNFITNIAITFKHGFLWKRKVRKRIKYCAESSGDFNG
jgi:hypothetical protein